MTDSVESQRQKTIADLKAARDRALELAKQMENAIMALHQPQAASPLDLYPFINMPPTAAVAKYLDHVGKPQTMEQITKAIEDGGGVHGKRQAQAQISKGIERASRSKPPKFWIVGGLVGLPKWPKPKK